MRYFSFLYSHYSRKRRLHLLVLVAVVLALYGAVLSAPFLWDDESLIVQNELIRTPQTIPQLFSVATWREEISETFYRPMQMVQYAFLYQINQLDPFIFRLANVLVHGANACLLYLLLFCLLKKTGVAFVGSLIFAVHPLHTEAISYISGTADLLLLFFALLMSLVYVRTVLAERMIGVGIAAICVCYVCALLSKESALILPVVMAAWGGIYGTQQNRGAILRCVALLCAITLGYWFVRYYDAPVAQFNIYAFSLIERVGLAVILFARYAWYLVFPVHLHMEHLVMPPQTAWDFRFLSGIVFVALFVYGALRVSRISRHAQAGIVWYVIFLLPVLNFIPINATFSEHWLYIPFVGVSILFALGYDRLQQVGKKRVVSCVVISAVLLLMTRSVLRNYEWADPVRFYEQTLRYRPFNTRILYNLGNVYLKKADADAAIDRYSKILDIVRTKKLLTAGQGSDFLLKKMLAKTHNNLGNAYVLKDDIEKAQYHYTQSLVYDRRRLSTLQNMAQLYTRVGNVEKAQAVYDYIRSIQAPEGSPHHKKGEQ